MTDFNTNIAFADAPDFPTLLGIKDSLVSVVVGNIVKCKCVSYSGNPRPELVWMTADNREVCVA